jgi:restriction system protein
VRLQGIVSFHVVFQCKRYAKTVQAEDVRSFRGAVEGRADRGLFITSGRFTSGALAEASREGARPIDLIDGSAFAEMLKQYALGISIATVEEVEIDRDWYAKL